MLVGQKLRKQNADATTPVSSSWGFIACLVLWVAWWAHSLFRKFLGFPSTPAEKYPTWRRTKVWESLRLDGKPSWNGEPQRTGHEGDRDWIRVVILPLVCLLNLCVCFCYFGCFIPGGRRCRGWDGGGRGSRDEALIRSLVTKILMEGLL